MPNARNVEMGNSFGRGSNVNDVGGLAAYPQRSSVRSPLSGGLPNPSSVNTGSFQAGNPFSDGRVAGLGAGLSFMGGIDPRGGFTGDLGQYDFNSNLGTGLDQNQLSPQFLPENGGFIPQGVMPWQGRSSFPQLGFNPPNQGFDINSLLAGLRGNFNPMGV